MALEDEEAAAVAELEPHSLAFQATVSGVVS